MVQLNSAFNPGFQGIPHAYNPSFGSYQAMDQRARQCQCPHFGQFWRNNNQNVCDRIRDRDPSRYGHDHNGQRLENGRTAQTQLLQQTDTTAALQVGGNKLSIDQSQKMLRVQNADGTEQEFDLKVFQDPHISYNGKDIGMVKNNLTLTLKDHTQIKLLMGDGKGGMPQPGAPTYLESLAARAPDGTGALITNISGPAKLGVMPLDSSYSGEFMEDQGLNKFGHYRSSQVSVDRGGNFIDQSTGQAIYNQAGLDSLDQHQSCGHAAQSFYDQGYRPPYAAQRFDFSRPYDDNGTNYGNYGNRDSYGEDDNDNDNDDLREQNQADMAQMLRQLMHMQNGYGSMGQFSMPFAYSQQSRMPRPGQWAQQNRYGQTA